MRHGEREKSMKLLERIKAYAPVVCDLRNKHITDDLMSGRAGYLYSLLYVYKHIEFQKIITIEIIRNVLDAIIKSGKAQAAKANIPNLPLVYMNYEIVKEGKLFLGSLYGMCGIIYMLLQVRRKFYHFFKVNLTAFKLVTCLDALFTGSKMPEHRRVRR